MVKTRQKSKNDGSNNLDVESSSDDELQEIKNDITNYDSNIIIILTIVAFITVPESCHFQVL